MPRSAGWSAWTTTSWWCFSPSASSVRRSAAGWPLPERRWRIWSFPLPAAGGTGSMPLTFFRYFRVGGLRDTGGLLPGLVGNRLHLHAALPGHAARGRESRQAVHRRPHHVVRVVRAQALGEDVAHARTLEHRAHRAARDHPGPRRGGLQQHAPRPVVAHDLMRDRAAGKRHRRHLAPGGFHRLAHRLADFVRLARGDADVPLPVAHGDERVEAEPPAALHHLGDAVDRDHVLDVAVAFAAAAIAAPRALAAPAPRTTTPPTTPCPTATPAATTTAMTAPAAPPTGPAGMRRRRAAGRRGRSRCGGRGASVRGGGPGLLIVRHQNSNPPLRAPSATAFTRPWYWYPPRSNTTLVMPWPFAFAATSRPRAKLFPVLPFPSTCRPSLWSEAPSRVTPLVSSTSWA